MKKQYTAYLHKNGKRVITFKVEKALDVICLPIFKLEKGEIRQVFELKKKTKNLLFYHYIKDE